MTTTDISNLSPDDWLKMLAAVGDTCTTSVPLGLVHGTSAHRRWSLEIWVSAHFLRVIHRGRLTGYAGLGRTLKNVRYGWFAHVARSVGGRDGIFAVTRDHKPRNEMMRKCFERGLDSPAGAEACTAAGISNEVASAVRVVSHAMRILAFVAPQPSVEGRAVYRLLLWDVDRNIGA